MSEESKTGSHVLTAVLIVGFCAVLAYGIIKNKGRILGNILPTVDDQIIQQQINKYLGGAELMATFREGDGVIDNDPSNDIYDTRMSFDDLKYWIAKSNELHKPELIQPDLFRSAVYDTVKFTTKKYTDFNY